MVVKVKCEALAAPFQAKKGFIRKFLIPDGTGGREVVSVYASDLASLNAVNGEITIKYPGDFAFLG